MSFIRQFIDRIYGGREQFTVTFTGLDAGGKTTLLYLLKLNETINTIPTFGFNIETFRPPSITKDGTIKESSVEIIGWDVGVGCEGPRYMVKLLQVYIDRADGLVWVVDSCDRERLQESVDQLKEMLRVFRSWRYPDDEKEASEGKTGTSKVYPQKPILVLANKQDLPNRMNIDEIRKAFAGVLSGSIAAVYPITLMSGLSAASGIPQAFDWLKLAVEISRERPGAPDPPSEKEEVTEKKELPHQLSVRTPGSLASKLDSWLGTLEKDSAPEEFLRQFHDVALPRWDHYTHIRLAYHILKIHGRQKGKDMIFDGIKKYITESKGSQTTGKTFHFTMTYFWIQIVHFGIQSMTNGAVTSGSGDSWIDEFARFLIINPFVVDGQLWADYYTKEVIMSPIARNGMVLPDKKPLPSIATRDTVSKLLKP